MEEVLFNVLIWLSAGLAVGLIAHFMMKQPFIGWFIYGALLWPVAAIHLAIKGFRSSKEDSASKIGSVVILVALAGGAYLLLQESRSFTNADITEVQSVIREEFEKRPGVEVSSVTMTKESAKKLTGYVSLKVNGVSLSRPCFAIYANDKYEYTWQCQ